MRAALVAFRDRLGPAWRFVRDVWRRYCYSGATLTAAAIAFFGLVCLTPLGIIAVAALQHFVGTSTAAYAEFRALVLETTPGGAADVMRELRDLLAFPDPAVTGGLGLLAVAWAAVRLFETLERALSAVWHDARDRGYLHRKLIGFAALLACGVGLTAYMVVVSLGAAVGTWLVSIGLPREALRIPHALALSFVVAGFALLSFFLLYKLLPARRVPTRAAALGAVAATVGFGLGQWAFTRFIGHSARSASVYGSLTSVVLYALWMYVVASLTLLGAHVAAQVEGTAMVRFVGPNH